jgi:hypothetical protein
MMEIMMMMMLEVGLGCCGAAVFQEERGELETERMRRRCLRRRLMMMVELGGWL